MYQTMMGYIHPVVDEVLAHPTGDYWFRYDRDQVLNESGVELLCCKRGANAPSSRASAKVNHGVSLSGGDHGFQ